MKKVLFCIIALTLIAGLAHAQDYRTKDMGLIFTFNDLRPQTFDGGVGVKFPFSQFDLRAIFGFGYTKDDNDNSEIAFGVGADLIKNLSAGKITPYIGGGAGIALGKESNWQDTSTFQFWLRAILGVEYFLRENISLAGEYRFAFTYASIDTENDAAAKASGMLEEEGGYQFALGTFPRLMLTVYFDFK